MSHLSRILPPPGAFAATGAPATARADLLLSRACRLAPERIAARVLAAIGESGTDLHRLRKSRDGRRLVLRCAAGFVAIGTSPTPLGAVHFARAIAPFSTAKRRAALMRVIAHHEAALSLRLHLTGADAGFAGQPLHRSLHRSLHCALAALAGDLAPIGLMWGAHGRLFEGLEARRLLAQPDPVALFVAPRLVTVGPRRLPAISFQGARELLGFGVTIHLLEMDFHTARRLGMAFVAAALRDATLAHRQSYSHDGHSARISHLESAPDITLIPLPARAPFASVA